MRRRSKTREEYVASLRWNIQDATEALKNAVQMQDWTNVVRYARQLQSLTPKLARAESGTLGPRRTVREILMREEYDRRRNLPRPSREDLERRGWQFGSRRR